MLTELGIDGNPVMIVVNVFDVVTVTVTTRCLPPVQLLVQLMAATSNTPASVAHLQVVDATAVMPVELVAAVAADCMPVVSTLVAVFCAPYETPARAASVSAIAV
jgi:hypothetical protein